DVREIEIDHVPPADAQTFLANLEKLAGGDVARNQVAIFRISLFQEIKTLRLRNRIGMPCIAGLSRDPDAPAFATGRFADQSALVLAGDCRRMHLNKLAIAISSPGLIAAPGGPARSDDRHG